MCSVYMQCVYIVCTVCAVYYSVYSMCTVCMWCVCAVCMCSVHMRSVLQCVQSVYSVRVVCVCSVYVQCVYAVCVGSVCAVCVCRVCTGCVGSMQCVRELCGGTAYVQCVCVVCAQWPCIFLASRMREYARLQWIHCLCLRTGYLPVPTTLPSVTPQNPSLTCYYLAWPTTAQACPVQPASPQKEAWQQIQGRHKMHQPQPQGSEVLEKHHQLCPHRPAKDIQILIRAPWWSSLDYHVGQSPDWVSSPGACWELLRQLLISELGLSPWEEKGVKSGPPTHGFREPRDVPALGHHRSPDHTLTPPSSCFPV
jgi:hypothetical protein